MRFRSPPTARCAHTAALLAALAVGAISGCRDREHGQRPTAGASAKPGTAQANGHVGAPGARVRIITPGRDASVRAPVIVRVDVSGFHLSARDLDKAPKQGWGHLHFRLDGGRYDRRRYSGANGQLAARLGVKGRFTPAVRPTTTYKNLPAGRHRLVVSLANNDLSETGVHARTVFTVR